MLTHASTAADSRSTPVTSEAELGYAEFLMVQEQLAALRALPESVRPFRSPRDQRLAELYNAFEHYTALADLVFEELQRQLNEPVADDEQLPNGDTDPHKLLTFPQRAWTPRGDEAAGSTVARTTEDVRAGAANAEPARLYSMPS